MIVSAKPSSRLRCAIMAAASLAGFAGAAPALAQADLLVAPTRIIINGGGSAQVVLSNIGPVPATYRISLELRRMSAEGDLDDVTEAEATPAERDALAMVRYAPRRITLPPSQPQSVRISARPGAELPDGEYRVHMKFEGVPTPLTPEEAAKQQTGTGLSIRLTPIYGITIPVIVRKGQLDAAVTIANPRVATSAEGSFLELEMTRSGARSVYGEIIVRAKAGGDPLFQVRGIAVYAELATRNLHWPLSPEQAAKLTGPVRIEYRETPENGGKLLAAAEATLR